MGGRDFLAAAVSTFQSLPCGTVKEDSGVLTQRDAQRQCTCIRCQYRCIRSTCPKGNISMFVGPVFQLENPTSEQNLPAFLWHYENLPCLFPVSKIIFFTFCCGPDFKRGNNNEGENTASP